MEGSSQLHAPAALPPEKELPVPIGYEAAWVPEPVWNLWCREKCLAPAGKLTPAVQPIAVAIPTELSRTLMREKKGDEKK
jgi:hypothetical protein